MDKVIDLLARKKANQPQIDAVITRKDRLTQIRTLSLKTAELPSTLRVQYWLRAKIIVPEQIKGSVNETLLLWVMDYLAWTAPYALSPNSGVGYDHAVEVFEETMTAMTSFEEQSWSNLRSYLVAGLSRRMRKRENREWIEVSGFSHKDINLMLPSVEQYQALAKSIQDHIRLL